MSRERTDEWVQLRLCKRITKYNKEPSAHSINACKSHLKPWVNTNLSILNPI